MPRDPLPAQIHIARKDLGLGDDVYRDVLERVTGSRSSAGLSDTKRKKVIREFRRMGWNGGWKRRADPTGKRRRDPAGSGRSHSHKGSARFSPFGRSCSGSVSGAATMSAACEHSSGR